jgi:hypothetical protein
VLAAEMLRDLLAVVLLGLGRLVVGDVERKPVRLRDPGGLEALRFLAAMDPPLR